MTIESVRKICRTLPQVTEDVKWGNERPGIVPAPCMARNMWVLEERLGEALDRRELERLLKTSYDLVVARLPKSKRGSGARAPALTHST